MLVSIIGMITEATAGAEKAALKDEKPGAAGPAFMDLVNALVKGAQTDLENAPVPFANTQEAPQGAYYEGSYPVASWDGVASTPEENTAEALRADRGAGSQPAISLEIDSLNTRRERIPHSLPRGQARELKIDTSLHVEDSPRLAAGSFNITEPTAHIPVQPGVETDNGAGNGVKPEAGANIAYKESSLAIENALSARAYELTAKRTEDELDSMLLLGELLPAGPFDTPVSGGARAEVPTAISTTAFAGEAEETIETAEAETEEKGEAASAADGHSQDALTSLSALRHGPRHFENADHAAREFHGEPFEAGAARKETIMVERPLIYGAEAPLEAVGTDGFEHSLEEGASNRDYAPVASAPADGFKEQVKAAFESKEPPQGFAAPAPEAKEPESDASVPAEKDSRPIYIGARPTDAKPTEPATVKTDAAKAIQDEKITFEADLTEFGNDTHRAAGSTIEGLNTLKDTATQDGGLKEDHTPETVRHRENSEPVYVKNQVDTVRTAAAHLIGAGSGEKISHADKGIPSSVGPSVGSNDEKIVGERAEDDLNTRREPIHHSLPRGQASELKIDASLHVEDSPRLGSFNDDAGEVKAEINTGGAGAQDYGQGDEAALKFSEPSTVNEPIGITVNGNGTGEKFTLDGLKIDKTPSNGPVPASEIFERLTDAIRISVRENGGEVRMTLRPESLGELRIRMNVENSSVKAEITVDSHAVKSVLEADSSALRDAFSQQGLTLEKYTIEVNGAATATANTEERGTFERTHREAFREFGGGSGRDEAAERRRQKRNTFEEGRAKEGSIDFFA